MTVFEDLSADIGKAARILHLLSLARASDLPSQAVQLDLSSLLGIIVLCLRSMFPD